MTARSLDDEAHTRSSRLGLALVALPLAVVALPLAVVACGGRETTSKRAASSEAPWPTRSTR